MSVKERQKSIKGREVVSSKDSFAIWGSRWSRKAHYIYTPPDPTDCLARLLVTLRNGGPVYNTNKTPPIPLRSGVPTRNGSAIGLSSTARPAAARKRSVSGLKNLNPMPQPIPSRSGVRLGSQHVTGRALGYLAQAKSEARTAWNTMVATSRQVMTNKEWEGVK